MLKVGITGGIGSGKTTIANIFIKLGIPVFFSDIEAAKIVSCDKNVLKKIVRIFGNSVLFNGVLDRKKLAETVFFDSEKLAKLNSIVHPEVRKNFILWMNKNKKAPYIIQEAAILIETGGYKNLDFIILVTAPDKLRIQRVLKREKISRENLMLRIANQWNDEKKKEFADIVIVNDGKKMILPQVLKLHKKFLSK